jgi:hypothetical protein
MNWVLSNNLHRAETYHHATRFIMMGFGAGKCIVKVKYRGAPLPILPRSIKTTNFDPGRCPGL